jgi:NAD(P)-dependent dehydrogenase (short-subunit alcohol dehydrogenase family)
MRWAVVVAVLVTLYSAFDYWCGVPVVFKGAVVVTGASSGIGRHAALFLAQKGFTVFATYRKAEDRDSLEKSAKELSVDSLLIPLEMDVTSEESVVSATRRVAESKACIFSSFILPNVFVQDSFGGAREQRRCDGRRNADGARFRRALEVVTDLFVCQFSHLFFALLQDLCLKPTFLVQ